jgi:hypothetical protein
MYARPLPSGAKVVHLDGQLGKCFALCGTA